MTTTSEPNPPNILIVDDMPANVLLLSKMLTARGYHVSSVLSGKLALQAARAEPPDLILLDITMPEMNGYEVCAQLKADAALHEIPVIFISALDQPQEKVKAFRVGGVDYVTKPFQLEEVQARVKTHLKIRSQHQRLETVNAELQERVAAEVHKCRKMDQELMQNEKMVSLGQLAAGVVHEINNPIGYISSNLNVLAQYFARIVGYDQIRQELGCDGLTPLARETLANRRAALDIEKILADGPNLIRESQEGAGRVAKIVLDLKNFSRIDTLECEPVALTSCLESALTIVQNELKYVATIRKEYESPREVLCHPGQLSQVFLNLLVNAGQAIVTSERGEIVLRSRHDDAFVYASVSDTGSGIPDEIRDRIFDPFFTTKEVGTGTGLGLSISLGIIKKHQGELLVESVVGKGTTFTVKLPRTPFR